MRNWAITFLAIGLIAGILAFAGVGSGAWTLALIAAFFVLAMDGLALLVTRKRTIQQPQAIHRLS